MTEEDLRRLNEYATDDAEKSKRKVGNKGRRLWADQVLENVERACGFTYRTDVLSKDVPIKDDAKHEQWGPARHIEFAVMLDHAARRVAQVHTWVKRAEASRARREADARKLDLVPPQARDWLDRYCAEYADRTGSHAAYVIRQRAVVGWSRVVQAWQGAQTAAARRDIVRALQAEQTQEEKLGDARLFEELADDRARCVWQIDGRPKAEVLLQYVAGSEAAERQLRYKVPAYCHPHPLRHPVFCDYGKSRWGIRYAVHTADGDADDRSVRLCVWDGTALRDLRLHWHGKRFWNDIASTAHAAAPIHTVSRVDRLGRTASQAPAGAELRVADVFEEKHWNGRLQVAREQLEALADAVESGKLSDAQIGAMRNRLRWFITFSPRLRTLGPWLDYAQRHGLGANPSAWPHPDLNRKRQGMARLILARLPGLRVLSVDLGHRYAAACAVWETERTEQVEKAFQAVGIPAPGASDLWARLPPAPGGRGGVLYRRIAGDRLSDGGLHPAPWARLERQFLIKLQGEEASSRKASPSEFDAVAAMERLVGRSASLSSTRRAAERTVAGLQATATRILRSAMWRHAERARVAFALRAEKRYLPGGKAYPLVTDADRLAAVTDAVVRWHGLFSDPEWIDEPAQRAWSETLARLGVTAEISLPPPPEDPSEQRKSLQEVGEALRPLAEGLLANPAERSRLVSAITYAWQAEDRLLCQQLRWLRDWLLPRGSTRDRGASRHVGGLSLDRLGTIRSLYRLQKQFHMRPEPDDPRKNIPAAPGDGDRFGQGVLDALERMRQDRVKQLTSRIVAAALGLGPTPRPAGESVSDRRVRLQKLAPRHAPCHAVVIEDLDRYRADQTRLRRENRQLMEWSAARIRDLLRAACELYGLHLRQVPAGYTSRQDSRTGAPGLRCTDVPLKKFLADAGFWHAEVNRALCRVRDGTTTTRDRVLSDLFEAWRNEGTTARGNLAVRVPHRGGEVFVSADPASPAATGLQADLNAAANIGLAALTDPDWPGRWWYVPCNAVTGTPVSERVAGCPLFSDGRALAGAGETPRPLGTRTSARRARPVQNLWHDVSCGWPRPAWREWGVYWDAVERRVANVLLAQGSSLVRRSRGRRMRTQD